MTNTLQMEVPNKVLHMNMSSVLELLQKYPIVTRKLLLLRPLRPGNQGEIAINKIADAFKQKAQDAGWDVKDLQGNSATKTAVENAFKNWKPDFFVYYGHSLNTYIPGQQNNQLVFAITPSNVSLLSNKTASVTGCSTLYSMGNPAIKAGAIGYLGYKSPLTLYHGTSIDADMKEATNASNIALIKGSKYTDAKDIGKKKWYSVYTKWDTLQKNNPGLISPLLPANILANYNGLDYVGNSNAVARPIGILLTTP